MPPDRYRDMREYRQSAGAWREASILSETDRDAPRADGEAEWAAPHRSEPESAGAGTREQGSGLMDSLGFSRPDGRSGSGRAPDMPAPSVAPPTVAPPSVAPPHGAPPHGEPPHGAPPNGFSPGPSNFTSPGGAYGPPAGPHYGPGPARTSGGWQHLG